MEYMTPKQAGELWGITDRRVQALCLNGRIKGAERLGGKMWVIPKDTPKPIDGRTKAAKTQKIIKAEI
ncbi:MAG: helix-turn-helix domain-containing protein [Gracilibacteraceae bacterium]|nr:helix-turn-helix domain-containing protein [Gracilibacteraceae bacterium]